MTNPMFNTSIQMFATSDQTPATLVQSFESEMRNLSHVISGCPDVPGL